MTKLRWVKRKHEFGKFILQQEVDGKWIDIVCESPENSVKISPHECMLPYKLNNCGICGTEWPKKEEFKCFCDDTNCNGEKHKDILKNLNSIHKNLHPFAKVKEEPVKMTFKEELALSLHNNDCNQESNWYDHWKCVHRKEFWLEEAEIAIQKVLLKIDKMNRKELQKVMCSNIPGSGYVACGEAVEPIMYYLKEVLK